VILIEGRGLGIVAALNQGIAAASAPYIARMDADDVSRPERLAMQKEFLDMRGDVGLVGCRIAFGGDPVASRGYALHVDWINGLLVPDEIALHRFIESPFAHPSVMFRRELPALHGGYREGFFPEDYELWLRWLDAGVSMAKLPETLLLWNDPADRLSRTDARYSKDAFFRIKAEYLARWLARHNPRHPEITTWGAGRLARRRAEMLLPHGIRIARHVDIAPRLVGRSAGGRPVIGPDDIPPEDFVVAFVASRGARDLIRARLEALGRVMGRDFMLAA
jgi:glycosyltransferase involved in cell wall biosynthesis